jgi:hypothetical protein
MAPKKVTLCSTSTAGSLFSTAEGRKALRSVDPPRLSISLTQATSVPDGSWTLLLWTSPGVTSKHAARHGEAGGGLFNGRSQLSTLTGPAEVRGGCVEAGLGAQLDLLLGGIEIQQAVAPPGRLAACASSSTSGMVTPGTSTASANSAQICPGHGLSSGSQPAEEWHRSQAQTSATLRLCSQVHRPTTSAPALPTGLPPPTPSYTQTRHEPKRVTGPCSPPRPASPGDRPLPGRWEERVASGALLSGQPTPQLLGIPTRLGGSARGIGGERRRRRTSE